MFPRTVSGSGYTCISYDLSLILPLFQVAIERGVMERVYKLAMFPNGDGDTQRDKIYSDSVARLAANVTPNHRYLF